MPRINGKRGTASLAINPWKRHKSRWNMQMEREPEANNPGQVGSESDSAPAPRSTVPSAVQAAPGTPRAGAGVWQTEVSVAAPAKVAEQIPMDANLGQALADADAQVTAVAGNFGQRLVRGLGA